SAAIDSNNGGLTDDPVTATLSGWNTFAAPSPSFSGRLRKVVSTDSVSHKSNSERASTPASSTPATPSLVITFSQEDASYSAKSSNKKTTCSPAAGSRCVDR